MFNEKDKDIYTNFLNQIHEKYNDDIIDLYVPVLKSFIDKNYVSNDLELFDLDDFIQEGLIILEKNKKYIINNIYNKGLYLMSLKSLYQKMKSSESEHFIEKLYAIEYSYHLKDDFIDFNNLLNNIDKVLNTDRKRVVFYEFLKGSTLSEIARMQDLSVEGVRRIKNKILRRVKFLKSFRDLYYDRRD